MKTDSSRYLLKLYPFKGEISKYIFGELQAKQIEECYYLSVLLGLNDLKEKINNLSGKKKSTLKMP